MIKKEISSDEIDLIGLVKTIFQNKGKIIIIIIISILCAIFIEYNKPDPIFIAKTKVQPLYNTDTAFDLFNSLNVVRVDKEKFYKNFISNLQEKKVFNEAIKKFNYVDKANFNNDELYQEEVLRVSNSIKIDTQSEEIIKETQDRKKWVKVLNYVKDENKKATLERIQKKVYSRFSIMSINLRFRKDNIKFQIQNANQDFEKKVEKSLIEEKFVMEDLDAKIKNSILDYRYKLKKRIAHLKEQAIIARRVGLAKASASDFAGIGSPDYLRGYEAIEKQIEIISNRVYEEFFIDNYKLKREKRKFDQSKVLERSTVNKNYTKVVLKLENQLRSLKQEEYRLGEKEEIFEKIKESFFQNNESFSIVIFDPNFTRFINHSRFTLVRMILLAIFLGLILGIFYVLLLANFRKEINK